MTTFSEGSSVLPQTCSTKPTTQIARENIAIGLARMVDLDYLGLEDAKEVELMPGSSLTPTSSSAWGSRTQERDKPKGINHR